MITIHNYYNSIESIDFAVLPTALQRDTSLLIRQQAMAKAGMFIQQAIQSKKQLTCIYKN